MGHGITNAFFVGCHPGYEVMPRGRMIYAKGHLARMVETIMLAKQAGLYEKQSSNHLGLSCVDWLGVMRMLRANWHLEILLELHSSENR